MGWGGEGKARGREEEGEVKGGEGKGEARPPPPTYFGLERLVARMAAVSRRVAAARHGRRLV